jgi:hypothetical protein
MGTIIKRTSGKGIVTYQAKIRIGGFKIISRTFSSHEEAEAWLHVTEPELNARSRETARQQAHARLIKEFKERPRIVADLLHRNLRKETVRTKGAEAETHHIRSILK